ncbi:MAG: hypothetical protein BM563_06795 [Bacteroidetes bacterium MedPE-SWsnd-G1]|nr:MAG: hypothetical protein BM563_06795 [Bacteroidetes bacterium MedPE-SWsnd-G1]
MNIQNYTYLINNPAVISKEQTSELESIINSFPYFQSARALHLKGLKSQDSYKYNQALKTTAAHTSDRSILFDFITSTKFQNSNLLTEEQTILENIEVIDAEIVKALHQKITKIHSEEISNQPKEVLEIGKPLNFKSNEAHSFGEWLQLGTIKPINRTEKKEKTTSKFDLIDKFIASNPKIKPVKNKEANSPIVKQESTDYDSLMTETLAQVYIEQKKYENAIKAYRILSLKYPEKSSFFANRIKAIKLLDKK